MFTVDRLNTSSGNINKYVKRDSCFAVYYYFATVLQNHADRYDFE